MMITLIRHKMIGNTVVTVNSVLGNRFRAVTSAYKVNSNHTTVLIFEHMFTSEVLAIADFEQTGEL